MKKMLFVLGLLCMVNSKGLAMQPISKAYQATVSVSSVSTTGGQAQITITTPTASGAYSAGYYTYFTHIRIEMWPAASLAGSGTLLSCTTTNLNSRQFNFDTVVSSGVMVVRDLDLSSAPEPATQGSNVSITCPATTNVRWNVAVNYFQDN